MQHVIDTMQTNERGGDQLTAVAVDRQISQCFRKDLF
jgi:hypothetical protein